MWNIKRQTTHPGVIIKERFMDYRKITPAELSKHTGIDIKIIKDIINEKGRVTEEIDKKICNYFGIDAGVFFRMQKSYDETSQFAEKTEKKVKK